VSYGLKVEPVKAHQGGTEMETMLGGIETLPLILFMASLLGGPVVLVDWLRKRRREVVMQQIALTDAIDGHFGAIVSPVVHVERPLWGPWQIKIVVPFTRPAAVGRVLALAHEVLGVAGQMNTNRYEILLTPTPDTIRRESTLRPDQPAERWSRKWLPSSCGRISKRSSGTRYSRCSFPRERSLKVWSGC
jgi:hypothetical protein